MKENKMFAGTRTKEEKDKIASSLSNFGSHGVVNSVESVWSLIKDGAGHKSIYSKLEKMDVPLDCWEIIIDIAKTRRYSEKKFGMGVSLFFTSEGLRWATPEVAAQHCAKRMKGGLTIDSTCGQGGQLMAFSEVCDHVIGMDLDPLNTFIAGLNVWALNLENVDICNIDSISEKGISMAEDGCHIFCDPARPPGASERKMEDLSPDPFSIMDAYDPVSSGMCFEVPPYISPERIEFKTEFEYISIGGRLNRLNLYTGDLMFYERSAVILPGGYSLCYTSSYFEDKIQPIHSGSSDKMSVEVNDNIRKGKKGIYNGKARVGDIVYLVDPTVVRAGLLDVLLMEMEHNLEQIYSDHRRTMLISTHDLDSPFLTERHKVMGVLDEDKDIVTILNNLNAGSVTLRYPIDPKNYWKKRKSIEDRLNGTEKFNIFKPGYWLVTKKFGMGKENGKRS